MTFFNQNYFTNLLFIIDKYIRENFKIYECMYHITYNTYNIMYHILTIITRNENEN